LPLPIAVSDTTVLIYLHHLDLLYALSLFYRQILVPAPVRKQFLSRDDDRSRDTALNILTTSGLFSPCDDYDSIEVDLYKSHKMDEGEAEALSQLKQRSADVLLIDEKRGRSIAQREMRMVQGTASILAKLYKQGFVDYWSAINRLRSEVDMRIGDDTAHAAFDNEMNS